MGLVIEKTESFPCVIVKKTFQVTCGVASLQIKKMPLSERIWTPLALEPRSKSANGYGPPRSKSASGPMTHNEKMGFCKEFLVYFFI